jgi:MFS transporter, MFS domain-containing protein family, molybdate-anion transporter
MSFYQVNLAVFAAGNAYLLYRQYRRSQGTSQTPQIVVKDVSTPIDDDDAGSSSTPEDAELLAGQPSSDLREAVRRFKLDYFLVYGLAVAADWLQGPHIYAIYRYEKQLPERTVAALYAAGFISGALSASVAGELADRYGRRLACLVYCAAYTLTCLSMLSDDLIVLFVGRLCGGVATTLLFSVFEAWLITEYHERGLSSSELTLSEIFAYMTTLSCIVAIVSGVAGDALVAQLGSRLWPFVASIVCCAAAGWLMLRRWVWSAIQHSKT